MELIQKMKHLKDQEIIHLFSILMNVQKEEPLKLQVFKMHKILLTVLHPEA